MTDNSERGKVMAAFNDWAKANLEAVKAAAEGMPIQHFDKLTHTWKDKEDGTFGPVQYRPKPKTIRIGGFDVPEPVRDASQLIDAQRCFLPDTFSVKVVEVCWDESVTALNRLAAGLIHRTAEDAQKHLDALLSLSREPKD